MMVIERHLRWVGCVITLIVTSWIHDCSITIIQKISMFVEFLIWWENRGKIYIRDLKIDFC